MEITADLVKKLREDTNAGVMDCKKALVQADGDVEKAKEILREQGLAKAERRANRVAAQGVIEAYIHAGGRIATLVEVNCETDFVARTDDFRALAHDLAMQVAATSPKYLTAEEVPADVEDDKSQICLMLQPFIKDPGTTVGDLIKGFVARTGENIQVRRFVRFELGEALDSARD